MADIFKKPFEDKKDPFALKKKSKDELIQLAKDLSSGSYKKRVHRERRFFK